MEKLSDFTRPSAGHVFHFPVLGSYKTSENLVEWSKKNPVGTEFSRETSWGLQLTVVANEEHPRVLVALNGKRLAALFKSMGPVTYFTVCSYGFSCIAPRNHNGEDTIPGDKVEASIVRPVGDARENVEVFHWTPDNTKECIPIGRIDFEDDGPSFTSASEIVATMAAQMRQATEEELGAPEKVVSVATSESLNELEVDPEVLDMLSADRAEADFQMDGDE